MNTRYIFLLTVLLVFGCRKKDYPEASESRENTFFAKLLVNGQAKELQTGIDRYYMYTSHVMDSSGVYNLISEFKQPGCANCPNSLRIQINDPKISIPHSPIIIDSVLKVKSYSYLSGMVDIGYSYSFTGKFNKQVASVHWDFGDGGTSSTLNPAHTFKTGVYKVALTITAPDNSQSTIINNLSVNTPGDINCYVSGSVANNVTSFLAHPTGAIPAYQYSWDFGDGTTGTGINPVHTYITPGGYGVTLKVLDSQLNTKTCFYNTYTTNDASACATNFSYSYPTYVGKRLGSKVMVSYIDENGVVFTSDHELQPDSSKLEILSVENFVKNENNEQVKKVKLKFNCILYNGSQSISLKGTEVIAGFSYK